MSVYLDASVLVSFFSTDALTTRADGFLRSEAGTIVVSDFSAAEFASAISQRVRTRQVTIRVARTVFADFDAWTARVAIRPDISPTDISDAAAFLRRLDLALRAPDAINIAVALRVGAALATFDIRMAKSARALGLALAKI